MHIPSIADKLHELLRLARWMFCLGPLAMRVASQALGFLAESVNRALYSETEPKRESRRSCYPVSSFEMQLAPPFRISRYRVKYHQTLRRNSSSPMASSGSGAGSRRFKLSLPLSCR